MSIEIVQDFGFKVKEADITQPYLSNPWVRYCLDKRGKNIGTLPFYIYSREEEENEETRNLNNIITRGLRPLDAKVNESSPYNRVFNQPHPLIDKSEFWKLVITYCGLPPGDCFILLLDINNKPVATPTEIPYYMIPIAGNEVFAKYKETSNDKALRTFEGWQYNEIVYKEFQLCQFRLDINPYNILRGIDPITSALGYLKIDNVSTNFNEGYFKNAAQPSGIILSERPIAPDESDRLEQKFQSRFGGKENAGKTPVFSGGIKWVPTQNNNRDSQTVELKSLSKEAIYSVYDTPLEDTADSVRVYWNSCIIPIIRKIEEWVEKRFFSNTPDFAAFDLSVIEALREDLIDKLTAARQLWEIGYPINRINERLELGMGEQDYGDLAFAAPGFVPIEVTLKTAKTNISNAAKPNNDNGPDASAEVGKNNATTSTNNTDSRPRKIFNYLYRLRKAILANDVDKINKIKEIFPLTDEIINDTKNLSTLEIKRYFNNLNKE